MAPHSLGKRRKAPLEQDATVTVQDEGAEDASDDVYRPQVVFPSNSKEGTGRLGGRRIKKVTHRRKAFGDIVRNALGNLTSVTREQLDVQEPPPIPEASASTSQTSAPRPSGPQFRLPSGMAPLNRGKKAAADPNYIRCPECVTFTCNTQAKYHNHLRQQHGKVECAICGLKFSNAALCKRHFEQDHTA